jgi:hypothetical protein
MRQDRRNRFIPADQAGRYATPRVEEAVVRFPKVDLGGLNGLPKHPFSWVDFP